MRFGAAFRSQRQASDLTWITVGFRPVIAEAQTAGFLRAGKHEARGVREKMPGRRVLLPLLLWRRGQGRGGRVRTGLRTRFVILNPLQRIGPLSPASPL